MTDYERMFDAALAEHPARLSDEGTARRAAMAAELAAALGRRRQLRRTREIASVLAAAALLLLLFWPRTPDLPGAVPEKAVAVHVVRNDPEVLSRYVVRNRPVAATSRIGDDELLAQLQRAGHSSGILRAGDRVILTNPLPEPATE